MKEIFLHLTNGKFHNEPGTAEQMDTYFMLHCNPRSFKTEH